MLVSDGERDRVLERLSAAHVHGMLGQLTFENRVEAALVATRRAQLDALLADLPNLRTTLHNVVATITRRESTAQSTDVRLPSWNDPPLQIGRSRTCDVQLPDDTVSRRHLELRPVDDAHRWLLVDLGSLNGTWFLGRRIGRTVIQAGDQVLLGRHAVTFTAP